MQVQTSLKSHKPASKYWRMKYRLRGKENVYAIGRYPDIGLKDARELARAAPRDVAMAKRVRTIIRAVLGFAEGRG